MKAQSQSRWRRLRSLVPIGVVMLVTALSTAGQPIIAHAAAASTLPAPTSAWATNEPIVSKSTVVPTPAWAAAQAGGKPVILEANCYQPTAAIYDNPLALTAKQIRMYGFPLRPPKNASAADLANWEYQVENSKHRLCLGVSMGTTTTAGMTNLADGLASTKAPPGPPPPNEHGPEYFGWGGYFMSQNSTPGPWAEESMAYTAPNVTGISECPTTAVQETGVWGGLGGTGTGNLAQEGMVIGVTSDSSCNLSIHDTLFVENIDNTSSPEYGGIYAISGTTVTEGDSMQADTFYDGSGGGEPEMYTADYTQSEYQTYYFGPEPAQNTFDCADELVNAALIYLANFNVSSCWGEAGGTDYYPGDNHFAYHEEFNGTGSTDFWYYPSSPPNSSNGSFTLKCTKDSKQDDNC